ncbi:uncharacterized protein ACIBXB_010390 [Morphnus guianensis]
MTGAEVRKRRRLACPLPCHASRHSPDPRCLSSGQGGQACCRTMGTSPSTAAPLPPPLLAWDGAAAGRWRGLSRQAGHGGSLAHGVPAVFSQGKCFVSALRGPCSLCLPLSRCTNGASIDLAAQESLPTSDASGTLFPSRLLPAYGTADGLFSRGPMSLPKSCFSHPTEPCALSRLAPSRHSPLWHGDCLFLTQLKHCKNASQLAGAERAAHHGQASRICLFSSLGRQPRPTTPHPSSPASSSLISPACETKSLCSPRSEEHERLELSLSEFFPASRTACCADARY